MGFAGPGQYIRKYCILDMDQTILNAVQPAEVHLKYTSIYIYRRHHLNLLHNMEPLEIKLAVMLYRPGSGKLSNLNLTEMF